jgi:hypothetical protein
MGLLYDLDAIPSFPANLPIAIGDPGPIAVRPAAELRLTRAKDSTFFARNWGVAVELAPARPAFCSAAAGHTRLKAQSIAFGASNSDGTRT